MLTNNDKKIRKISAKLSAVDIEIIKIYIKGAVYSFCNNNRDSSFSVRILFGGENRDWHNTPLQKIYDYYIVIGKSYDDAAESAAIDAGRLLKAVLDEDAREFEIFGKDTGTLYRICK